MFVNLPSQQLYGQLQKQHNTKLPKDHKLDTYERNTQNKQQET